MLRRRFLFTLAITIAVLASSGAASHASSLTIDADQQFLFASQLYQDGQYRRAAEEFERFAFFFPHDQRQREAVFKAGEAFFRAGDGRAAANRFQSIVTARLRDDLYIQSHFMLARCYILLNQPNRAISQLHALIGSTEDEEVKDGAYLRITWIYIDQMDWQSALKSLQHVSPEGRERHDVERLEKELATSDQIPQKNPTLAGALSILPGAGQLYCGRYEDALAAFIVNGALFWASYESFDNDLNALGGILLITGLGFYAGNIYGAVNSAHKFNQAQKRSFSDQVREHLIIGVGPERHGSSNGIGHGLFVKLTFNF